MPVRAREIWFFSHYSPIIPRISSYIFLISTIKIVHFVSLESSANNVKNTLPYQSGNEPLISLTTFFLDSNKENVRAS